jgi:hypothetical protein
MHVQARPRHRVRHGHTAVQACSTPSPSTLPPSACGPPHRNQNHRWLRLDVQGVELQPQAQGDLGDKLAHALHSQLQQPGIAKALVVGSDIPGITPDVLARAAAALDQHEVMLILVLMLMLMMLA